MSENRELDDDSVVVLHDERQEIKPPNKYDVVMLNDDYTPMDLVVLILMKHFAKSKDEAEKITMDIHSKGEGLAGTYNRDIAETKAYIVMEIAKNHGDGHPLKAVIRKIGA